MKTTILSLVALASAAASPVAGAHEEHAQQHCDDCELRKRWERRHVSERRFIGVRDVQVDRQITEYEMRTVTKRIRVGTSRCGFPRYEIRTVCERVPVIRTVQVCEKQPVYETVSRTKWVQVPYYVCLAR